MKTTKNPVPKKGRGYHRGTTLVSVLIHQDHSLHSVTAFLPANLYTSLLACGPGCSSGGEFTVCLYLKNALSLGAFFLYGGSNSYLVPIFAFHHPILFTHYNRYSLEIQTFISIFTLDHTLKFRLPPLHLRIRFFRESEYIHFDLFLLIVLC